MGETYAMCIDSKQLALIAWWFNLLLYCRSIWDFFLHYCFRYPENELFQIWSIAHHTHDMPNNWITQPNGIDSSAWMVYCIVWSDKYHISVLFSHWIVASMRGKWLVCVCIMWVQRFNEWTLGIQAYGFNFIYHQNFVYSHWMWKFYWNASAASASAYKFRAKNMNAGAFERTIKSHHIRCSLISILPITTFAINKFRLSDDWRPVDRSCDSKSE